MLIHTYEFIIPVKEENLTEITLLHALKPFKIITKDLERLIPGIKVKLIKTADSYFISVHLDAIKALHSYKIMPDSLESLLAIHDSICSYFLINNEDSINLTRIDYRLDVEVGSKENRELILKLFKKTRSQHYHLKKERDYSTTVSLENKNMEVKVYDKEQERIDKGNPIPEEEEGILRFEVALRNRHLKYNKKKKGMRKDISTYHTTELFLAYMMKVKLVYLKS